MPIVTGVPWPTAVTVAGSPAPAGSSPSICTSAGIPPGQEVDATRNLRWVSTRRWTSSKPSVSTSHFMRARSLLSRLPAWSNTLKQASIVGSNSSRGVEVLQSQSRVRGRAQSAGDEHPEAALDRAVVGVAGNADHADVIEHGLAAVRVAAREVDLELAGKPLADRIADEVPVGGLGPGRHVEFLVGGRRRPGGIPARCGRCRRRPPGWSGPPRPDAPAHRGSGRAARSETGCSGGW